MGNSADRSILVLWLLGVSMVTWRELRHPSGVLAMPAPSAYVGTIIVYGAAALVGEVSPPLGVALAFGWTLALAYSALGVKEAPTKGAAA